MIYTLWSSFFAQRIEGGGVLGSKKTVFVGLENYIEVLTELGSSSPASGGWRSTASSPCR